jgi:hypothetical protein
MLGRRALPAGRLARLGATPDFHHVLLASARRIDSIEGVRNMYTNIGRAIEGVRDEFLQLARLCRLIE